MRDSELAPTKSGVVGLVAAALGLPRGADIRAIAALRMGVRTDRPGIRLVDYHTALDVVTSDGKPSKDAVVSQRAYLADAAFLVGLEGRERELLEAIQAALLEPRWPLGLGRRAFPPSLPVAFHGGGDPEAIVEFPLEEALRIAPPVVPVKDGAALRFHIEDPTGDQEWFDQPIDDFRHRGFRTRRVKVSEMRWGSS